MAKKNIQPLNKPGYPSNEVSIALELSRWHLQKAISLRGQVAPYLHKLALAEFLAESYETAEAACRQSLQLDPANYEVLLLLAESLLRQERPAETWKAATQAIKLYKHREEAWLLAARAAVKLGESKRAIDCLELYLQKNKDQLIGPQAYILLAQAYLNAGQPRQALDQLEQAQARLKALFIPPGYAFVALRARILRKLDQTDESLNYYEQALQLAPEDTTLHNELGEALMEQGDFEEALKAFSQAVQLAPSNALYYCNAGIAAREAAAQPRQYSKRAEGFQQQAVDLLTKATQLDGNVARYWYELALAYQATHNYKQTKQALVQALTQVPAFSAKNTTQVDYLRLYAFTCQKLGDFEGARKALNQVLVYLPNDHETLNEIGELSYKLGNYSEAFNYFRKAELQAPDHTRYLANMSRVMLRLERLDEARELIEEAVQLEPHDHFVRHQLGAVLLEAGHANEAVEALRDAAGHEPDNAEFRYYLGRAYLNLGQIDQAIREYQAAVANAPMQHQWYAELGEIYLREHSYLAALDSWRMAAQLEPSEPSYRYNLAIALAANGDVRGAIATLREVMAALEDSTGAEWHYLLGRLLLALGRQDEALDSFAEAYELEPSNPHYKVDLARSLRLKGEPIEQVKTLLEEAIADNPHELRSFEELAYVYEASDNPEAALRTLESRLSEVLETVRTPANSY